MRLNSCCFGALLVCCGVAGASEYRIEIDADRNLNVRGTVTLTWQNETGQPAVEIPMFCSGKMKKASAGGTQLRIAGKRVLLREPVAPGGAAKFQIEFEESAKRAYGYRMLTGPWHPKAVTFRNGAYNANQPQADDYEVTLTAPASLVVAAAGAVIDMPPLADVRRRWRWRLEKATSFGLAASPDFVETRRTSEGVEVRLFQLRGEDRFDAVMADYASDAIAFYKQTFGFYPHPALVMLPGQFSSGGGYAPASGFAVFHRNTGEYQRWIAAHEIAHQYWGYDTVIDDGDFCHWPGLALGIYSDQQYMAPRGTLRFGSGQYRKAAANGLDTTIRRTNTQMRSLKFDWNNIICHQKAYVVVRMLEDLVGPDRFLQVLMRLLDKFRNRYLSFQEFQTTVESVSGQKLDWFFHDWVDGNGVASYAIEEVSPGEGNVEVRIRRTGTARFAVEVRLTAEDGSQIVKRISHEPEVQALRFDTPSRPKKVEIDPRGRCPLIRHGKEVWQPGQ